MRVFLKYVEGFGLGPGEDRYMGFWRDRIESLREKGFSLAATPQASDVVLVIESGLYKCWRYAEALLRDDVIVSHWEKICCVNYDDNPAGFLPGLYANLPSGRMIPSFHEPFCYFFPPRIPEERLAIRTASTPTARLLFSFRGAPSHPVRRRLFEFFGASSGPWQVTYIDRWYNHTLAETDTYYAEIMESAFVLCPRGISTTTKFPVLSPVA